MPATPAGATTWPYHPGTVTRTGCEEARRHGRARQQDQPAAPRGGRDPPPGVSDHRRRRRRLGVVVLGVAGHAVGAARAARRQAGAQRADLPAGAPRQGVHRAPPGPAVGGLLRPRAAGPPRPGLSRHGAGAAEVRGGMPATGPYAPTCALRTDLVLLRYGVGRRAFRMMTGMIRGWGPGSATPASPPSRPAHGPSARSASARCANDGRGAQEVIEA